MRGRRGFVSLVTWPIDLPWPQVARVLPEHSRTCISWHGACMHAGKYARAGHPGPQRECHSQTALGHLGPSMNAVSRSANQGSVLEVKRIVYA